VQDLPIFVAGVIVGIVLAGAAFLIRGRSVGSLGATAADGPASEVRSPSGAPAASADAPLAALGIEPESSSGFGRPGLHLTRTKVVRRVAARLKPGGRLTVTVDGQEYHRLEDIPDPAARDQVRTILESLPAQAGDPALREKIEGELQDAGIDPDPGR